MKKILKILVCLISLFLIQSFSHAYMKLIYDGKEHIYKAEPIYLYVNGEKLNPPMPPILLNGTTVVPARAIFEKLGAQVGWYPNTQVVTVKSPVANIVLKINSEIAEVNGVKEKLVVPAKIINGSTMIPLRFVSEKLGLKVNWNPTTRTITIKNNHPYEVNINKVTVSSEKGKTFVKIEASEPISQYNKFELSSPDRIVIDVPNSIINVEKCNNIVVANGVLDKIRASQYQVSPNQARIVLDLVKRTNYSVNLSSDKKAIIVNLEGNGNAGDITEGIVTIGPVGDFEWFNNKLGDINRVSIIREGVNTGLAVTMKSSQDYEVSRVTEPDGIAVDIINADFSEGCFQIPVQDTTIKYLKALKHKENVGRIIIGVHGQPPYQVFQEPGKLSVFIFEPSYKNIKYLSSSANESRIVIESGEVFKNIVLRQEPENKRTILNIPAGIVDLGAGNIHINDALVRSIEVINKSDGYEIMINHNYDGTLYFNITKGAGTTTVVNISKSNPLSIIDKKGKYLVVIDPGHGGSEPGAVYNKEIFEKDLNLDIALRLNRLLKEAKIDTVMTRETDVYVGLYERANIANRLQADLFVSIHNNWIDIPSYSGTMTLYYPYDNGGGGLTSKRFAEIVQEELLKKLGSIDRKIIPRPNLVVLNSTKMPAVLAEIGFISNKDEREKLLNPEYREKAAIGLYNGIIRALNELGK